MFTGIVKEFGKVLAVTINRKSACIKLEFPASIKLTNGGSVAINGVCLSARDIQKNTAVFDCMPETIRLSSLGGLSIGDQANIEMPLSLQAPLGGHILQGHVDGIGKIFSIENEESAKILSIKAPKDLQKYLVKKGSIALDGVSLTIVDLVKDGFTVGLIPLTQSTTNLGRKKIGSIVNLEIDILAKMVHQYVQVQLHSRSN